MTKILMELDDYIWVAVDVRKGVIAAGDELMSCLKRELVMDGCDVRDVFGAGLDFVTGEVDFYSQINVRFFEPGSTVEVPEDKQRRVEALIRYFFEEAPVFQNVRCGRYVRYAGVLYN